MVKGIERNYNGSPSSYSMFLGEFKRNLINLKKPEAISDADWKSFEIYVETDTHPSVLQLIEDNIDECQSQKSSENPANGSDAKQNPGLDPPRHMFVRTEGTFIDNYIVRFLKKKYESQNTKVIYLPDCIEAEEDVNIIASKLSIWIKEGCILVLKDMDKLYSLLQEVLNMSYTTENKMQYSKIIYDRRERRVQIGRGFRCIVLQSLNRQPASLTEGSVSDETYAPFLNRLEKYYLPFRRLLDKDNYERFEKAKNYLEARVTNYDAPEVLNKIDILIHDYSADYLASTFFSLMQNQDHSRERIKQNDADSLIPPTESASPNLTLNQEIFQKF